MPSGICWIGLERSTPIHSPHRIADFPPPAKEKLRFETAEGPALFVDPASLPLLGGARVDYTEALVGARFLVVNRTARSGCGCGMSFDV